MCQPLSRKAGYVEFPIIIYIQCTTNCIVAMYLRMWVKKDCRHLVHLRITKAKYIAFKFLSMWAGLTNDSWLYMYNTKVPLFFYVHNTKKDPNMLKMEIHSVQCTDSPIPHYTIPIPILLLIPVFCGPICMRGYITTVVITWPHTLTSEGKGAAYARA